MNRLKPSHTPDRYVFIDPDTAHLHEGSSREALIQAIQSYRQQNDLPQIEALEMVLENYWCSLPENQHICEPARLERSWLQYVRGGVALLRNMAYPELVTSQQANERAMICINCPHNVFPDKEGFVRWSDDLSERATGGMKAVHHEELGNCQVCSCNLKAKVWYKGKLLHRDEFPEYCWQHRDYRKT